MENSCVIIRNFTSGRNHQDSEVAFLKLRHFSARYLGGYNLRRKPIRFRPAVAQRIIMPQAEERMIA